MRVKQYGGGEGGLPRGTLGGRGGAMASVDFPREIPAARMGAGRTGPEGTPMAVEFKAGLKDVIAVNSSIATVDGEIGQLTYRGYDIRDLARQATYEEVVHLLWHRELPTRAQ